MSGEQQLERSVLEGKERDELVTIADALGLKPPSRAKKADLVDSILQATGVETAPPAPPKPRRRARRTDTGTDTETGTETGTDADAAAADGEPPAATVAAPLLEDRGAGDPSAGAVTGDGPDSEAAGAGEQGDQAPEALGAGDADAPTAGEATPGDPAEAAAADGDAEPVPGGDGASSPDGDAEDASANGAQRTPAGTRTRGGGGAQQPAATEAGERGDAGHARPTGADGGGQPGPGTQAGRVEPETGNRRSRRRRGRDRERVGAGYDQQVQQAEAAFQGEPIATEGILDVRPEGFGFLRTRGYLPSADDVYVSTSQVRKFSLRAGDHVVGAARPASAQEKFPALLRIDAVSGMSPDDARGRPRFESLTPLFPDMRLQLEVGDPSDPANLTGRIIDLLCPIGKGQRGLIVSPPKAGKTTVMKHIAKAIERNHPEVDLMILLVDERPEEVTDMRRSIQRAEVIGSTFDRPSEEHTHVAELAIEVAKRRVEQGRDVVVILDGITRLARAYNLSAPATGRVMSGGLDSGALYPPKKFFGAARNVEEGGSLTILATALVETGSVMDTVIFEEFKGTGNMELRLDRRLAERRMYPSIDVTASSTRHEELLLDRNELRLVWQLRRVLVALSQDGAGTKGYELLLEKMKATRTNDDFLEDVARSPAAT